MIDPREFRRTLGRFATGITVVSMRYEEHVYGITVNAFMSVSLSPPLIAVCIDKRAQAHATLLESERFGISILRAEQEELSDRFAGRTVPAAADPFEDLQGFPVVGGALAQLVCRTYDVADAGDHSLFLGEVEALAAFEGRPLLYFEGRYGHVNDMELTD
jgi:flavin reductase (DIM6/NTAB) family NADH-FMN oxidoreductase RutF